MNTSQRLKKLILNSSGIEENQKASTLEYLERIKNDEQALTQLEELILSVEKAKYNQLKAELKVYQLGAAILQSEKDKKNKKARNAQETAERQEEEMKTAQLLSDLSSNL